MWRSGWRCRLSRPSPNGWPPRCYAWAGAGDEVAGASHQQIAETIGASRETVTRALGDFRAQGLIELGRSHILIRDRAGLQGLARDH
jgi:CRP-like cAMP-binding protein